MFELIGGRCYHDSLTKPNATFDKDYQGLTIAIPRFVFYEPTDVVNATFYSLFENPLFDQNWN